MRADLHLHTTASDGRLTPIEIVRLARRQGIEVIAITDHDSVEGVAAALAEARSFVFPLVIPGVEISTEVPHGEVHILGYFVDHTDPKLNETLKKLRCSRRGRAQRMVARLRDLGINIEWERVQELAGDASIGRPHIAQAMLERGYIGSIKEAFVKYIGRYGPAYVEREKMTPVEVVELVIRAHGLPVLAHPADIEGLETFLLELERAGLIGIEAYYDGYTPDIVQRLVAIAEGHGLIPCGGSDYHGLGSEKETMLGDIDIPAESVEHLISLAKQYTEELSR